MNFRNAKKLHNGDQVAVKALPEPVYGTVINAYILPIEPKVVRVDVLTNDGRYMPGMCHSQII